MLPRGTRVGAGARAAGLRAAGVLGFAGASVFAVGASVCPARRAAARLGLERWGRVRGSCESTPVSAAAAVVPPLLSAAPAGSAPLSLSALTCTSLLKPDRQAHPRSLRYER